MPCKRLVDRASCGGWLGKGSRIMTFSTFATLLGILLGSNSKPVPPNASEEPIEFVCGSMQLYSESKRARCVDEVVMRRGNTLVCCDSLEGQMDAQGAWTKLVCENDVRVHREGEFMWATYATWTILDSKLVLTGTPVVQRGPNMIQGERIVVMTGQARAQVFQPRGRLIGGTKPAAPPTTFVLPKKLPRQCPLPSRKSRP
jgi:lipopolysaccharide export system protein LptA